MPKRSLSVGSDAACDVRLLRPGVAPRHIELRWEDGLVLRDLGAGETTVDGRTVLPNQVVQLTGFHAKVVLGSARLDLTHPALSALVLERTALPITGRELVLGRDPARAHVLVRHPTVSGAHARVDLRANELTDLGSKSGTFDRSAKRLVPGEPRRLDLEGGFFVSTVWVSTSALLALVPEPRAVAARPAAPRGESPAVRTVLAEPSLRARAAAPSVPPTHPAGRTVFGRLDVTHEEGGAVGLIGRLPSADIVLPFPQVSARHASVTLRSDGILSVTDLGSTNGTHVRGERLHPRRPALVAAGERVFIGPYAVVLDVVDGAITAYVEQERPEWPGNLVEIEALDLFLKVPDREDKAKDKVLLNHVTFKARPGDMIALMGPSGAGKTTLLTALNGYLRPTSGEVRVNGENLYAIYDALRGSIGYVPQDDIVHPELTVCEAIRFSAKLRLPPDYSDEEIERRVEQTLHELGLEQVRNLEIGKPEKKILSGGQRKRVNIALELVTDPALLFLDEPTSGLAADDTVALIDLLGGLAKKSGKTIIVTIHQPAREEYEKFNLALIMGFGGEPLYYGPTGKDSYDFFGKRAAQAGRVIDNPRDMFDLLKQREEELVATGRFGTRAEARLAAAQAWRAEFFRADNPVYCGMFTGERAPGQAGDSRPPTRARPPLPRQFRLLLERYAIIKRRDQVGAAILLLQAPIIGALLAAVYMNPAKLPNLWCQMVVQRAEAAAGCALPDPARFPQVADYGGALFFMVIASMWFGTSNAAREIVAEQAIYKRERMVNLSIWNYILSKYALLSALCFVQCFTLLIIVYPTLELGGGTSGAFPTMLGMMVTTSMCAAAMGLLISTLVRSAEAAMALTPIALIPQIILGGRMVPMTSKGWLEPVMALIPARWSFEGMLAAERRAVEGDWVITTCASHAEGVEGGRYQCALEEIRSTTKGLGGLGFASWDRPSVALLALVGMGAAMLVCVALLLKRRDTV